MQRDSWGLHGPGISPNRLYSGAMFKTLILATAISSVLNLCLLAAGPGEKAPELRASSVWINADAALKLSSLKGKVVLIDFLGL